MREKTSAFAEDTLEEALIFAAKLKQHGLEKHEEIMAYLEALPDDQK